VSIIIRRPKCALATPPSATPSTAITSTALTPKGTKLRPTRRQRREDAARALAPIIKEIREAGHHSNAEIAKCLDERGLRAPSGGEAGPQPNCRIRFAQSTRPSLHMISDMTQLRELYQTCSLCYNLKTGAQLFTGDDAGTDKQESFEFGAAISAQQAAATLVGFNYGPEGG
jgi:hypothetical protein